MDNRKEPESKPCPKCGKDGTVQQALCMLSVGDPVRLGIIRPGTQWKEQLQKIHARTAGSNLNTSSTVTPI